MLRKDREISLEFITGSELFEVILQFGFKAIVFFIILGVGWVVGKIAGSLIGRFVRRSGGDSIFRKTAIGRSILKAGYTASDFSRIVTKIVIYITSILIALQSLEVLFVTSIVQTILSYIPSFIGALIIVIVGFIISDWIGEFVKKSFTYEERQAFYVDLIGDGIKLMLYFITITITLAHLGVDVTILYIFAQALAWGIAISLGAAAGIVIGWLLKNRLKDLLH